MKSLHELRIEMRALTVRLMVLKFTKASATASEVRIDQGAAKFKAFPPIRFEISVKYYLIQWITQSVT
jgi:hypothetical protein